MDNGQIDFTEGVGTDALGEPGSRLGGFGEDHRAAYRPVQPVNEAHVYIAGLIIAFLHIFFEQGQQIGITGCIFLHGNIYGLHNT
ncbi:hypothetical protein D3C80_1699070 [compost metagenome]